jgi:alkanesulfonate monooxygenase SsuD/methylene tetrahydromethanopterin reductase-like flavin-dependent oxidoreductase (luciferase family)
MHSLGLIAETDEEAQAAYWPYYRDVIDTRGRERGFASPTPERFEAEIAGGALFVGSPETVALKIAGAFRDLHLSRFDLKYDLTDLPVASRRRTIELFGREVIPHVRELLAREPVAVSEVGS